MTASPKQTLYTTAVYNGLFVSVFNARQVDGVWHYDIRHIGGAVSRNIPESSLSRLTF